MELFKIKDLVFNSEEFLDNINEFEDLIPIIQDLQKSLTYEEINCVGENDCCNKTDRNYIVEIQGYLDDEDEFYTKEELIQNGINIDSASLDPFIIRVYKCVECGKWIIDILE
ncbi:hypothetical protein H9X78_15710 [Clostridium saudiense]|nr:hypothetical protein [Clostridium saudiense]